MHSLTGLELKKITEDLYNNVNECFREGQSRELVKTKLINQLQSIEISYPNFSLDLASFILTNYKMQLEYEDPKYRFE